VAKFFTTAYQNLWWKYFPPRSVDVWPSAELLEIFEGKKVVLTGPSEHIVGLGQGTHIEGFDLVARINFQWPIPLAYQQDLGKRMDILFHCANGDFNVGPLFNKDFKRTQAVFLENGPQFTRLMRKCRKLAIPCANFTRHYHQIAEKIGTYPNTGTTAIFTLLGLPIKELFVTGITSYQTHYYEGYLGSATQEENWVNGPPAKIWNHEFLPQLEFLKSLTLREPRFKPDSTLKALFISPVS